jgi:hypothetical protein
MEQGASQRFRRSAYYRDRLRDHVDYDISDVDSMVKLCGGIAI